MPTNTLPAAPQLELLALKLDFDSSRALMSAQAPSERLLKVDAEEKAIPVHLSVNNNNQAFLPISTHETSFRFSLFVWLPLLF